MRRKKQSGLGWLLVGLLGIAMLASLAALAVKFKNLNSAARPDESASPSKGSEPGADKSKPNAKRADGPKEGGPISAAGSVETPGVGGRTTVVGTVVSWTPTADDFIAEVSGEPLTGHILVILRPPGEVDKEIICEFHSRKHMHAFMRAADTHRVAVIRGQVTSNMPGAMIMDDCELLVSLD